MESLEACPVCESERVDVTDEADRGNQLQISCSRCGHYWIAKMARFRLRGKPDHKLSAWLRHRELVGTELPLLRQDNLEEIRSALPSYTVSERSIELLKALALLSAHPGSEHRGNLYSDSPLAWAVNEDELNFHFEALKSQGFVDYQADMGGNYRASMTPSGWFHVERGPATELPRAFVAMSFSQTMLPAWVEGLRPGIEDAGYSAHRVDSEPHVKQIDQKIVADIRVSRFVVVDVTEQKQGAYFEAGLALGFNKTVIWTVRADEIDDVHFDTRQFAHIVWRDHAELRSKLRDVIVAVMGSGPRLRPV